MTKMMKWTALETEEQIDHLWEESKSQPVLIFKHSTRCAISNTILNRLERNWQGEKLVPIRTYLLDLLSYGNISQRIADSFNVTHESPQLLIVQNGQPALVRSHLDIRFEEIRQVVPAKN